MRRTVTDERVARYVGARVNRTVVPPYTAMGVEIDGEIAGGVIFNCFMEHDLHVTVAGERRAWSRGFFADVGDYLFRQLGVERVTIITEQPRVVAIAQKLGGEIEGRLRNHFGRGRDGTLIGILKDDWRY